MFLTFVDFEDQRYAAESHRAVEVIKQVQEKFGHVLGFFYVDNRQFLQKKRILGITWDELPAMAFNMVDQRAIPYPRDGEISRESIFSWFDDVMTGKI